MWKLAGGTIVLIGAACAGGDGAGASGVHRENLTRTCDFQTACLAGQVDCGPCAKGQECFDVSAIDGSYPSPMCVKGDSCAAATCGDGSCPEILEQIPGRLFCH